MSITSTSKIKHTELPTPKFKIKKTVSFSTIDIRLYEPAMSFNPSCSSGPALELGWNYTNSHIYLIDDYEAMTPSGYRRNSKELIIPLNKRENILKEVGYSRQQIENCIHVIEISKIKRRSSMKSLSNCFSKLFHMIPKPVS